LNILGEIPDLICCFLTCVAKLDFESNLGLVG
jgi:hypothetical protein